MTERKASMGDKVYRGDVVKFIRNNISLGTFMKRTVKTADEACWNLCDKLNYVPAIEEKPEPHWIPGYRFGETEERRSMSKYVIELRPDCKVVQQICEKDGQIYVGSKGVHYLEELTVDYIKKNCKSLLDAFYQKGLDDGKAVNDKGCEGCKYAGKVRTGPPCISCCNSYKNQWKSKDDKIEVGDEVYWSSDCFIVTRIFQPRNMKEQCEGIDDDGCVYHDVLMDDLEKTGRHFDIDKILEDMRND